MHPMSNAKGKENLEKQLKKFSTAQDIQHSLLQAHPTPITTYPEVFYFPRCFVFCDNHACQDKFKINEITGKSGTVPILRRDLLRLWRRTGGHTTGDLSTYAIEVFP